ncbi:AMP-binding protein [Nocardia sp. NPDC024068]|uniref:AMP-binding protein n=1 Tax=Nocardia sp. NPDC024068 TaxID=3157197 RepID=UPI0033FFD2C3
MPTTLLELERLGEPASAEAPSPIRIPEEWTTGVELSPVPGIAYLMRCGRSVPESRTAIRFGTETLTYGTLFQVLARPDRVPVGTPVDRLIRLLGGLLGDAAGRGVLAGPHRYAPRIPVAALAVAVADRRSVAAERKTVCTDRALGTADVRLYAAAWSDVGVAVELLSALADGAALVIADEHERSVPGALVELIERHGVTHVTGTLETVAGIAAAATALPTVCRWDITGTAPAPDLPGRLRELAPRSLATFAFTSAGYAGAVTRGCFDGTGRTRPIPGARVQVLDPDLRPAAPGVIGEVYVGGAAVGTPGTSAAFVPDPLEPGGRLFRTGERGTWTSEGRLVFA